MSDIPDAPELLAIARSTLLDKLLPRVPEELRYDALMIANAMQSRLTPLGAEPVGSTPEQFAALIREDIARWARVVKASGIGLD